VAGGGDYQAVVGGVDRFSVRSYGLFPMDAENIFGCVSVACIGINVMFHQKLTGKMWMHPSFNGDSFLFEWTDDWQFVFSFVCMKLGISFQQLVPEDDRILPVTTDADQPRFDEVVAKINSYLASRILPVEAICGPMNRNAEVLAKLDEIAEAVRLLPVTQIGGVTIAGGDYQAVAKITQVGANLRSSDKTGADV
jgi:hypothetical protein